MQNNQNNENEINKEIMKCNFHMFFQNLVVEDLPECNATAWHL